MSLTDCCIKGFAWGGTPTGKETKMGHLDVYVAGDNPDRAILFIHDAYGWTFDNNRLLADHFAAEVGATVYLPDFFFGHPLGTVDELNNAKSLAELDMATFIKHNNRSAREPEIVAFARKLREKHARVGGVGHCYGGWANMVLGSRQHKLLDCLSVAHPSMVTKELLEGLAVPTQIHAPEVDGAYTEELKAYSNEVIPKNGVAYEYVYYPGIAHGFATRGDPKDGKSMQGMVRAKEGMVAWFRYWLVTA